MGVSKRATSVLIAGVVVAGVTLTACSSSSSRPSTARVEGVAGEKAVIDVSKGSVPSKFAVQVLTEGSGRAAAVGDVVVVNYSARDWSTGKELASSYELKQPGVFTVGAAGSGVVPAFDHAVVGHAAGSRLLVTAPPSELLGAKGSAQGGFGGKDTVVFALDIVGVYSPGADIPVAQADAVKSGLPQVQGDPGSGAPKITIPAGAAAPSVFASQVLVNGTGAKVASGQTVVVQYAGVTWAGKPFDSSWQRGVPAAFQIGTGGVIPAWDEALVGVPVGSRVLVVAPPAAGYGPQGNAQAGISGSDTLVFVVDVVDAR